MTEDVLPLEEKKGSRGQNSTRRKDETNEKEDDDQLTSLHFSQQSKGESSSRFFPETLQIS